MEDPEVSRRRAELKEAKKHAVATPVLPEGVKPRRMWNQFGHWTCELPNGTSQRVDGEFVLLATTLGLYPMIAAVDRREGGIVLDPVNLVRDADSGLLAYSPRWFPLVAHLDGIDKMLANFPQWGLEEGRGFLPKLWVRSEVVEWGRI